MRKKERPGVEVALNILPMLMDLIMTNRTACNETVLVSKCSHVIADSSTWKMKIAKSWLILFYFHMENWSSCQKRYKNAAYCIFYKNHYNKTSNS